MTKDILQKTEQTLMEELQILNDPNVGKERKTKAKRNIKNYEKYLRDNSDKEINGKKYPARLFHSGPEPINKQEVLGLIDSVDEPFNFVSEQRSRDLMEEYGDMSGVSVGKNRFEFIELD
jgi:hypothetical protein